MAKPRICFPPRVLFVLESTNILLRFKIQFGFRRLENIHMHKCTRKDINTPSKKCKRIIILYNSAKKNVTI